MSAVHVAGLAGDLSRRGQRELKDSVARVRSDRFEVAGVEADPYGEVEELCDRIGNR